MKTQTLLLGEYASSAFYIYMIPSSNATHTTDYLSIHDLYQLFFHHSPSDINPLFYTFFQSYPQHFYHDQRNQCYIAKQHVLTLARCLQLFALAEFCTLSHDELINRIADPLFATTNALMLRPVKPKRIDMDLDWFPLPDHSFFSSFLSSAAARYSNADIDCSHPDNATAATYHHHRRLPYFSAHKQNDHSWSRHFLPLPHIGMERALRAQKQQQAVIECRQRLHVYHQSSSKSTTKKEKQQAKKPGISNSVTASSPVNNALESSTHHHHHHQRKRKSSSPPSSSPPAEGHPHRHLHNDLRLPPPSFYFPDHHRAKKIKSSSSSSSSSYNNLDLLATQATKLKGLPLSPEISPPPPPVLSLPPISSTSASFYSTSFIQSLPSIRNVLSDI